jgi:TonB family protein
MSRPASEPPEWSRARWLGAVAIALVAQVGLLFLLSERNRILPRRIESSFTLHLAAGVSSGSPLAELIALDDPTLFVLADRRGFSGSAWMQAQPVGHEIQDWSEPVPWLTNRVDELGAGFRQFARTNIIGPRLFADKPAPQVSQVAVAPVPLRARSAFRLEGAVAGRGLLRSVEVPSESYTNILTNTVIQVSVNPLGFVFSASVLVSSGSIPADQDAVVLAKALRFKPALPAGPRAPRDLAALSWGKVVFAWRTTAGSDTNSPTVGNPQ